MKKKVAVIGFGFMGITHAQNILKNKSLELVAIVDKDLNSIEEKLHSSIGNLDAGGISPDALNGIQTYQSFDDCLRSTELDAVHICVHTDLHYEMAKKALEHGIHVLIEKPICLDTNQGEELIQLAKKQNRILMVAHVVRFMPPYQKLKEWVDQQTFGSLKFVSLSRFTGLPQWGQWKEKQASFGSSGGALFDLVIHDIDFAAYLLGTPDHITCEKLPGLLSKHDYISAVWSYEGSNVKAKIDGGNTFHPTFPFQAGFMAQFEKASISYSSMQPEHIVISDENDTKQVPAGNLGDGYFNEIAYFAQCLLNNEQPKECMPESSVETIDICYRHV